MLTFVMGCAATFAGDSTLTLPPALVLEGQNLNTGYSRLLTLYG
jgi:hypothetical protein